MEAARTTLAVPVELSPPPKSIGGGDFSIPFAFFVVRKSETSDSLQV